MRARSLCVMTESGSVIFCRAPDEPHVPASTLKLLTAFVARQWVKDRDLSNVVRVEAADLAKGSTMKLRDGDVVTWNDLFHGLIIPSGNDAARVIARIIGTRRQEEMRTGNSEDAFLDLMRAATRGLGWEDFVIASPSGLEGRSRLSARQICSLALKVDPYVRAVASRRQYCVRVAGANERTYDIKHSLSLQEWALLPALSWVKTGTRKSASIANLVAVWRGQDGVRNAACLLGLWPTYERGPELRRIIDFLGSLDASG